MTIKDIHKDILNLRNARGQQGSYIDEYVIDILNILKALKRYEIKRLTIEHYNENDEFIEKEADSVDEYLDYLEELYGLEEVEANNSYNWMGRVSNDFNYNVYRTHTDTYLVKFMVHRYGDIRGNYTDPVLLEFAHRNQFFEAILECDKWLEREGYYIRVSALSDTMEVTDQDDNHIGDINDFEEFKELIGL